MTIAFEWTFEVLANGLVEEGTLRAKGCIDGHPILPAWLGGIWHDGIPHLVFDGRELNAGPTSEQPMYWADGEPDSEIV